MPQRNPKKTFFVVATVLVAAISIVIWRLGLAPLYAYLIGINVVTLLAYGYDKHQATGGRSRVPEIVLQVATLVGGTGGALVSQGLFRHKTRKAKFRLVFVAIVVLQLLAVGTYVLFVLRADK